MREGLRAGETSAPAPDKDAIPPEVQEALVLNHYARHYRGWLDESIPALDDRTPRAAAKSEALRPKLIDLLHELDRMYQRSLKLRMPAYDPSWMWAELGLEEEAARHPPPLAHERVSQLVPGSGELCRSIAEAMRRRPGFKETSTVFTETDAGSNLEPQRFLREHQPPDGSPALAPYLDLMVNFELHRRKAFWVDESLALMLAYTELDALGRELRVPFPSFALVLTDRNALSLGERLLAREQGCPLAGHYLRVATVFVTEQRTGDERTLQVCFAFDALGADLPHLVHHSIPMNEDRPVESYLESLSPRLEIEPAVPDTNPVRGLLQVTLNAILYATSAGVEPETRSGPGKADGGPRRRAGPPLSYSSEAVYFLPGAIEISHLRRMQELERIPDGRTILRRFMVRGHWRRAAPDWADQRMRWIQPYWKGPDMAAIIERTYKLKP